MLREDVQHGLITQADVKDLVGDFADFEPGLPVVGAFVYGEVDEGGFRGVVLPGG